MKPPHDSSDSFRHTDLETLCPSVAISRPEPHWLYDISVILYSIKFKLWVCMFIYVCTLIARERINRFASNLACVFRDTRKRTQHSQNSGQVFWVRVLVRAVPVARKLSRAEERRQTKVVCFEEQITERRQHRKTVLGSSTEEGSSCSSETKHDRRTAPRQNLFVSARRLQEQRSQTRKLPWVWVPVKMLSLGILLIIFFSMSFDGTEWSGLWKASGNEDCQKCKHLRISPH
jgi:hypothetical protein